MCGILAIVSKDASLDLERCEQALGLLQHRGPDGSRRLVIGETVFLGHTLLSIVDEPARSYQPFQSRDGTKKLFFNGEIYNYKELRQQFLRDRALQTSTDTEVLVELHASRDPCDVFGRLDGMFAYVVYDSVTSSLYIARDLIGEKSLYAFEDEALFVLCSEIPPILALVGERTRVDREALSAYFLTRHWISTPETCFARIREVPAGSVLKYDLRAGRLSTLLQASIHDLVHNEMYRELSRYSVEELRERLVSLLEATAAQMVPAGQEFASIVSGGIDSAVVTRSIARHRRPDTLICLRHPGNESLVFSLGPFEAVLGRRVVTVDSSVEEYASRIRPCIRHAGAPLHTHSFVSLAMVAEAVHARSIRVLFGGDGGDEVFGGYRSYVPDLGAARDGEACPSAYSSIRDEYRRIFGVANPAFEEKVGAWWKQSVQAYEFVSEDHERLGNAMLLNDTAHELPPVSLRQADLMGMMHSVEVRSLLVRKGVLEFGLNLPLAMKLNLGGVVPGHMTKVLLSEVARSLYGDWILKAKEGFSGYPNESCLWLGDVSKYLVFDVMGIRRDVWDRYADRRDVIWKLVNTEWFLREFESFL
jgi:asparagine synthase (glutamine-hydrolysing)